MKSLKITSIITFLFVCMISAAQAATDHNSSRSNKTSHTPAAAVDQETDSMISEVSRDASSIASHMIAIDQKDGYTGEYEVTVDVGVSIKRVAKFKAGKALADKVK